ncbi:MAG: hypothetical protein MMC23_006329 [Stictis urceolatum]|nr:hypothetical protein [Stictis urceolata]
MANADNFLNYDFDPRHGPYQYTSRLSWPLQHSDASTSMAAPPVVKRSTSPLPMSSAPSAFNQTAQYPTATMMQEWQTTQAPATTFALDTTFPAHTYEYGVAFQTSPTDYLAPNTNLEAAGMDANMQASLQMNASFMGIDANDLNTMSNLQMNWDGMNANLMGYGTHGLPDLLSHHHHHHQQQAFSGGSPSETYLSDGHLEVVSLPSTSSEHGWSTVNNVNPEAIFNPEQTLHPRTFSDSSLSDRDQYSRSSMDGYVDVGNAISSPETDSAGTDTTDSHSDHDHDSLLANYGTERTSPTLQHDPEYEAAYPAQYQPNTQSSSPITMPPIAIRQTASTSPPQRSPVSSTSSRKITRKLPSTNKTTANKIARRSLPAAKGGETEKRVGRRKGPLRPDQRKQASEIRKLGACIRCRFLKKTCDKGEPCGGCKPSHARLWLVPCTRIDIKDLGYFLKDWQADYQRHVSLGFSIGNIKGFSDKEKTLFVTHGYGHYLPIQAREVYVRDERVFGVDWVEQRSGQVTEHEVDTAKLSAGMQGISMAMLSDYLDRHIDGSQDNGFENFVDEHFEGTPFITEILKTAFRFWQREQTPVIRKALKLMLAYNLTQAICLVKAIGDDDIDRGLIDDEESYFRGQIAAPVMINFQVKCAMADMWRQLQKDILEELSALYSSVYSKDKLRHWPTIFMLASILLTIWEEMQFDCRYRIPDAAVVEKFCNDMESTPVGVIVGLFSAISQKVPAFAEWDTRKHHTLLGSNPSVCTAMEEVRSHIEKHDKYLRARNQATFDRNDFDCLSNMFVSKLVIRAH